MSLTIALLQHRILSQFMAALLNQSHARPHSSLANALAIAR